MAEGSVKPARAAAAPKDPARCNPSANAVAASGARQKLAKRHDVGVAFLVDPFAPDHQFVAEIAEMGDRPTERAHAQFGESSEHFPGRAGRERGDPMSRLSHCRFPG